MELLPVTKHALMITFFVFVIIVQFSGTARAFFGLAAGAYFLR